MASDVRFFTHSSGAKYVLRKPSENVSELYRIMPDGTEKFLKYKNNCFAQISRITPDHRFELDKINGFFSFVKDRGDVHGYVNGIANSKKGIFRIFDRYNLSTIEKYPFVKRILHLAKSVK